MIPKVIHYCWFGRGELPELAKKCIASWQKYCPDYEIIQWNEDNFDVSSNEYAATAYKEKKWAFVCDYVRVCALEKYGGIYLDTDVEVLRPFGDEVLHANCVLGFEAGNYIATSFMAASAHHPLMIQFRKEYDTACFQSNELGGSITNVVRLTELLEKKGAKRDGQRQRIGDIDLYPAEWFSPYDYRWFTMERTENSRCVHYFAVSWMPASARIKKAVKRVIVAVVGKKRAIRLREIFQKT